jgi:hypothetical protein
MINSIDTYTHAGTKAGTAARHRDMATARHWTDWSNRAARLEAEPHRTQAREAFRSSYRAAATRTPRPFA